MGNVVGVVVDASHNVWIAHRPLRQTGAENTPPVLAFDQTGELVHASSNWSYTTHSEM